MISKLVNKKKRYKPQKRTSDLMASLDLCANHSFPNLFFIKNTGLQKKFPRINNQDSVRFSPAEYEYESHFSPSRPDSPKFYDKGLNINKIGCL